ncbi:MAG: hypothetical protein GIX03_10130 [Candidatus Eremiobacteraeota bacterium]|nr:hypothetical protein [Candidatus Eremiobacteraeota bacterium]MBC5803328.1 hypothetical protein [Candidatus Eremiobacteraeota bacterium]MBC5822850.1 hypothetical protein [Candidatus Eremiobacteraeota bacterium]
MLVGIALLVSSPRPPREAPPPAPSPSPRATLAGLQADPCGGTGRLLATLDRPTVGYSACAVPKGAIVLEEGYQNTFAGGPAAQTSTAYPQGFERVGVARGWELDLIGPNANRQRSSSTITGGYSDMGLGFKYELPQEGRFTYAVDGLVTAATGTGGFSNGGPTQTLNIDVSYAASPAFGIGTTLATAASTGFFEPGTFATSGTLPAVRERYITFEPSLVVTLQWPHDYQLYAELVGQTKTAPRAGGRLYTDFGLQKLLGPYLEIDGEYGIDFTPSNGSRFNYIGVGAGIRVK